MKFEITCCKEKGQRKVYMMSMNFGVL